MKIHSECAECGEHIVWVDWQTGGWWDHVNTTWLFHDPDSTLEVIQEMDDQGYYEVTAVIHHG